MKLHIRREDFVAKPVHLEAMLDEEERMQYDELDRIQAACVEHRDPTYRDPEGDGCPSCGWGAK